MDNLPEPISSSTEISCINKCKDNSYCVAAMLEGDLCYLVPQGVDTGNVIRSDAFNVYVTMCAPSGNYNAYILACLCSVAVDNL